MLYVSRYVGNDKYGIVDTDDNTETVVSRRELGKIVRLGLDVQGVETELRTHMGVTSLCICGITVQQSNAFLSAKQAKVKVLSGIDITTSGDEITAVNWNDDVTKPGTRLRLSDYAPKCADSIFISRGLSHKVGIVVVLDDKIKVRRNTFLGAWHQRNLLIDVTEVTNSRVVQWVYEEWIGRSSAAAVGEFIIDGEERQEKWRAVGVVCNGVNYEDIKFSDAARDFVESMFFDEFDKLSRAQYKFASTRIAKEKVRNYYLRELREAISFWRGTPIDYISVRAKDNLLVFDALGSATTCNYYLVNRFFSYMKFFEPTERLKEVYLRLCYRANRWFIDMVYNQRWR